ncbi:MAG: leucine-rich repeat domain-containing protein [Firmicutes bacterium]|nr:leucine-rich repeat domain-containing protein [Bacillota bacterium]
MPFVEAKCTNCGAVLPVDSARDAWVCGYCGTPFVVEKAIQQFNITNNITADTVVVQGGSKDFEVRGGVLLKYNGEAIDVVVPDGIVEIGGAFNGCKGVRSIVLPESIEVIGTFSFCDCVRLHYITLPKGLREIQASAFKNCTQLHEITIPDSIRKIYSVKENDTYQKITQEHLPQQQKQLQFRKKYVNEKSIDSDTKRDIDRIQASIAQYEKILQDIIGNVSVFSGCSKLSRVIISDDCYRRVDGDSVFVGTPFLQVWKQQEEQKRRELQQKRKELQQQEQQQKYKQDGLCQHCGGKFSKRTQACKRCSKPKDY